MTPKAKLGAKAQKYLKKGAPIDDQVIVDIIVEAIRWVCSNVILPVPQSN